MTEELETEVLDTESYDKQALVLVEQLGELIITDEASDLRVESIFNTAHENIKKIETHMETQVKDAFTKHRKLITLRKRLTDGFEKVKAAAKAKRLEWAIKNGFKPKGAQTRYKAIIKEGFKAWAAADVSRHKYLQPNKKAVEAIVAGLKHEHGLEFVDVDEKIG